MSRHQIHVLLQIDNYPVDTNTDWQEVAEALQTSVVQNGFLPNIRSNKQVIVTLGDKRLLAEPATIVLRVEGWHLGERTYPSRERLAGRLGRILAQAVPGQHVTVIIRQTSKRDESWFSEPENVEPPDTWCP